MSAPDATSRAASRLRAWLGEKLRKPVKAPAFLGGGGWDGFPPLHVDGRPLDEHRLNALAALTRNAGSDEMPEELAGLRALVDRLELDQFAWRLCERWIAAGGPPREAFALRAAGWLGGDGTAMELAKRARELPEEKKEKQAVLALDALYAIGTDPAILHLHRVAEKLKKWPALQNKAIDLLDQLRQERRWTQDQMEDRIAPDGGLDENGTRVFDYGPRQFWVMVGPELKPVLRDDAGAIHTSLPRAQKTDDTAMAAACAAEWDILRKSLSLAVSSQVERLKIAMEVQRHWTPGEFHARIVRHPLIGLLARRVIWGAFTNRPFPDLVFRVNDDRTLSNVEDMAATLEPAARIKVIHPAQLSPDEVQRWLQLLNDYEIIAPFPQLLKPCSRPGPDLFGETVLTQLAGKPANAKVFHAMLQSMKWHREAASLMARPFKHDRVTALMEFSDAGDAVVPGRVWFGKSFSIAESAPESGEALPFGSVDPVVYSETVRHILAIEAKALVAT